jgi:prevent-host-death family protein
MPTTVELDEAQARLKEIIARLGPDDEVVITDHNRPVARLVGGRQAGRHPRQAGNCKGMITLLVEDEEHLKDFREYMP